jgi:23S rRNA pseudouridine1911/1915/1917 synthase
VVVEKPSGDSSVPYERKESGTAMDLVRAVWRHAGKRATTTPLYVVHRIDKDTSGLLCFAKTRLAERALHGIFQRHEADRAYLAVAEGDVPALRIESRLVADRGDGIRGSTRRPGEGQRAVTHIEPLRQLRGATLCRVRLETGRTHQIRIHLAERGHPLVGETVYVRDLQRAGGTPLPSPRLLLHAARLGFAHPVTGAPLAWRAAPPPDFAAVYASLGGLPKDLDDA